MGFRGLFVTFLTGKAVVDLDSFLLKHSFDNRVETMVKVGAGLLPFELRHVRQYAFEPSSWEEQTCRLFSSQVGVFCSLLTNTVVQTYNAGKPVWSCCWCLDNSNYIYAGLSNGSVLLYDTRDTSTHVQELLPACSRYRRSPRPFAFRGLAVSRYRLTFAL